MRNKDTDIELMLGAALNTSGIGFEKNFPLPGKPDMVIIDSKIVIFCDGDFWHGRNYSKEAPNYNKFWKEKIRINMERDKKVNNELKKDGWKVFRFWETDIYDNLQFCINKIKEEIG